MSAIPIQPFRVTVATNSRGLLAKEFDLNSDGTLRKGPAANLTAGTLVEHTCEDLVELQALRKGLTERQALIYGTTGYAKARVVAQRARDAARGAGRGLPVVARDGTDIHWPDGPGVLFIDHDPADDEVAMTASELRAALVAAEPALAHVTMLVVPSAGSCIYEGSTERRGVRGLHAYVVVDDAAQITRIGETLFARLVLAGRGRIAISEAGTLLERACVDAGVWQPERLDFLKAKCHSGLEQRLPLARLLGPIDEQTMLDSGAVKPLTDDEERRLAAAWAPLRAAAAPAAAEKRAEWARQRAKKDAERLTDAGTGWVVERAAWYVAAASDMELHRFHELKLEDGSTTTVAALLADPRKYDGVRMHDPFEPDYAGGDRRIARAFLNLQDPYIRSFAHGGIKYSLSGPEVDFGWIGDGAAPAEDGDATAAEDGAARAEGVRLSERESSASSEKRVVLTCGADIVPEAVRWLWPEWLARGKLHILAGAPGQGKTTLGLALCATITAGGRWPDGTLCSPGNVLIWSGEDDAKDTLVPRLIASGADMGRVFVISGTNERPGRSRPFDPAQDMQALAAAAEQIGGVSMLLVDPVVSAVGRGTDSHKNTEVRNALQPLVDLASKLDCALLGVSHFSKGTAGRDPTERVAGSLAFSAVARVVLYAAKSNTAEGVRLFGRAKSNVGPDEGAFEYTLEQTTIREGIPASRALWGKFVDGRAQDLLAEAETAPSRASEAVLAAHADIDAFLEETFPDDEPVGAKTVLAGARAWGLSPKVVRREFKRRGGRLDKAGMQGGWNWRLPRQNLGFSETDPPFP